MEKGFLIIFLIIILLSTACVFLFYQKSQEKFLTNTTELYSLFAPYMEETVNYHLRAINCQPTKYYYENSSVCFVCDNMDACFGYTWIMKGSMKMNPWGTPFLKNIEKISVKIADFYKDSLASRFNCKLFNDTMLRCDYGLFFQLEKGKRNVNILLEDTTSFDEVADIICNILTGNNANCTQDICRCENSFAFVALYGNVIIYDKGK
jgi:hypothetical protein